MTKGSTGKAGTISEMLPPAGKSPNLMAEEAELGPARLGPPALVVSFYLGSPPAASMDLFLLTQPPVESLSVPKSDTLGNLAPPHPIPSPPCLQQARSQPANQLPPQKKTGVVPHVFPPLVNCRGEKKIKSFIMKHYSMLLA